MVEAQLVKELLVVSSTNQQSKHRRLADGKDMTRPLRVVTTWVEFQIPFFMGRLKGGFHITLWEANALRGMHDVPGTRRMQTANSGWSGGRRP